MSYQYSNLTTAISDKTSPLRRYLDQRYPNRAPLRDRYRARSGPLKVEAADKVAPGTLSAAFDFLLRFGLEPGYRPDVSVRAAPIGGVPEHLAAMEQVFAAAALAGRAPHSVREVSTAARACWAIALSTELYRNPALFPGSPLRELMSAHQFTAPALLALAPAGAVEQMLALHALAGPGLADLVSAPTTVVPGPSFTASRLCAADADLIVDGVLIEIKTRLGETRAGGRADVLSPADIYQMIGYALFDTVDTYRIHSVALYSSRYGTAHRWELLPMLETLAGSPVDLATERGKVWDLLGGTRTRSGEPGPPTAASA